jgi:enamine deaminase RidA (YjgF/YER057c/UK114 family)
VALCADSTYAHPRRTVDHRQPSRATIVPSRIETRLEEAGLHLPQAAAPAANYVPWQVSGKTLWISGQLPLREGRLVATGKLGQGVTLEQALEAARWCALNLLAQAREACGGDLDRLQRCLKLTGFVSSAPSFVEHHKVVNGASDMVALAMGEAGRHARSAVGVAALPLDAAVEVEGVFELA